MNKKTSIFCILAILISSSITYYISTHKGAKWAKFEAAVADYVNDCPGTKITEVYIERGEKYYSLRCEEVGTIETIPEDEAI